MIKIVFLEDEDVLGRIYKKHLEKLGHDVEWIRYAKDLFSYIEKELPVDLFLIDHGLKGEDATGLEVIQEIRKKIPEVKIIMLSNFSTQEMKKTALENGVDLCLLKIDAPPKVLSQHINHLFE
jgi:two-component system response regulator RegA